MESPVKLCPKCKKGVILERLVQVADDDADIEYYCANPDCNYYVN